MSTMFVMKLNSNVQPQLQVYKNNSIEIIKTNNFILSATKKRVCASLKITGNKKCSSCGNK